MDMAKPIIRFKGYQDDWEQRKFSEFVENVAVKNREGLDLECYAVTNDRGFISQKEAHDDFGYMADVDTKAYNIVPPNSFAYNPARINVGSIGYYTGTENVIVSSLYEVFQTADYVDDRFLWHWFKSEHFPKWIERLQEGSVRLYFYYDKLIQCEMKMPSLGEQKKIGAYFDSLDHLITLHQRKCDETKRLKKYMLQKMFPQNGKKVPEIRFSGFTDDWEQRKLGDLVIDHNAGIYISKEDYGEGTNVIGVGNIYDRDIFDGEIYRLGPVNDDKFILDENDILYGESSLVPEGIARTVCVGKNGAGSAFAWHTRRVKLDKNIVNSHVATLELNYLHDIRKYLVSVSTQTALTGMTTEGYFGVTLTLPSVEEQQKISDYFKNLDHLITLHQRELENLQNIKKFMLEKMFV